MKENKNIVTYHDAIEEVETYEMYYQCPNCENICLTEDFKFCPECGIKLEWALETAKELIEKIKKEIKIKSNGYIFMYCGNKYIIKNNEIIEVDNNRIYSYDLLINTKDVVRIIDLYNLLKCLKGVF